jgi:hypothetical protein
MSVGIGELEVYFVVDTGSSVTIIDEWVPLRLNLSVQPQNLHFVSASGHALIIKGQVQLELKVASKLVRHDCLVASIGGETYSGLLGIDFLEENKGAILTAEGVIEFPWGRANLVTGSKSMLSGVRLLGGAGADPERSPSSDSTAEHAGSYSTAAGGTGDETNLQPTETDSTLALGVGEASEYELGDFKGSRQLNLDEVQTGSGDAHQRYCGEVALFAKENTIIAAHSYEVLELHCSASEGTTVLLENSDPFDHRQFVPTVTNVQERGKILTLVGNEGGSPWIINKGCLDQAARIIFPEAVLDQPIYHVPVPPEELVNPSVGTSNDISPDFRPDEYTKAMSDSEFLALFKIDCDEPVLSSVKSLLLEYRDTFVHGNVGLGKTTLEKHVIDTGDAVPVRRGPYRIPYSQHADVQHAVQEMLDAGVIRESTSAWNAPLILVRKKTNDGSVKWRPVLDFRGLNKVTKRENFPFPNLQEALDQVGDAHLFSVLDLCSGYWQVEIEESSKEKTSFATPFGQYECNRLGFGLMNAPSTFVRLMSKVLCGILKGVAVYMDDLLVYSTDVTEHLRLLREVLNRVRKAGLRLKPEKCVLLALQVLYLGHILRGGTVSPDPRNVSIIKQVARPLSSEDLKSFLGMVGWYSRFIQAYAKIALPLTRLTRKKVVFLWTRVEEEAFRILQKALCTYPVLKSPRLDLPWIITTDASIVALGAIASQVHTDGEHVVAYASYKLRPAETRYSITELECYAVVYAVRYFRAYIYGTRFLLRVDHSSLTWLLNLTNPKPRLARWVLEIAEYQYDVQYTPGKKMQADALTRLVSATSQSSQEWTTRDIIEAQARDVELQERVAQSPSSYHKDQAGILYLKTTHGRRLLAVPAAMTSYVLDIAHNGPLGGHQGVNRTIERVRQAYSWPGLYTEIRKYVTSCIECQKRKGRADPPAAPQLLFQATRPFQRISIDIIGPLSPNTQGNRVILTCIDNFTRWPEAIPLPDQRAHTVARALVENVICRYGVMEKIISDCGRNFISALFREICSLLRIKHITTTPYHPQGNSIVERSHQGLTTTITQYLAPDQGDWDMWVPYALFVARSSTNRSTVYSPADLMYGRQLSMPWVTVQAEAAS